MVAQFTQIPPITVVMFRHTGPFDQMPPKFEQLWNWVTANNVPAQRTIGIYYDNPDVTPANQLRSAACVEVPLGYQMPNTGGLPLELAQIAGGAYATTRYIGPYEAMEPVWTAFTKWIEESQKRQISDNPAFEVYVNDPSDTPPDQLITEMYMPVI